MHRAPSDNQIKSLLTESTTIAVVGMSPKSQRPSNSVALYLIAQGYRVIPVNPGHNHILGLTCYPELSSIPGQVEIVDIFRKSSEEGPIVDQAVDCEEIDDHRAIIAPKDGLVDPGNALPGLAVG